MTDHKMTAPKVASFFSGAGGLDLGFCSAGFNVIWANEYDRKIWETYEKNNPGVFLDKRDIIKVASNEVPDCDGIIGGPPCQSWSEAGSLKGIKDKRGQLFFELARVLADKQPKFFLAENVAGMLMPRHKDAFEVIRSTLSECGYRLSWGLLNAADFGVPQDRQRIFFVGYRKDLGMSFVFPAPAHGPQNNNLKAVIWDLKDTARPSKGTAPAGGGCIVPNHEYLAGNFSPIFLSRNRVRCWDQVSFTIVACGRHMPLHPQAPKMELIRQDRWAFAEGHRNLYRRLTVREAARIQTFPDSFAFYYSNINDGYKMVGNAVPARLGELIARKIYADLEHSA